MKIAVTYENGNVFEHFGHCKQFKIYTVENNQIVSSIVLSTMGQGHGALASFLALNGVNALICGGIGAGAKDALAKSGISIFPAVSGNTDNAVEALLNGTLVYNPNITCSHHHNHGNGHDCGGHSCSEDKHGCSGNH